jgi:hypothetical protein
MPRGRVRKRADLWNLDRNTDRAYARLPTLAAFGREDGAPGLVSGDFFRIHFDQMQVIWTGVGSLSR